MKTFRLILFAIRSVIQSPFLTAGDSGLNTLIEVCSTLNDSHYEQISRTYTVLPSHLEQPVYDLAQEITSIASSPYDKALALQSWLSRSCRYTLEVDNQPANVDFVTRFLLDTKEGYCTYFASALTVLCRMIGIPARYVEGYLAVPNERGEALVTGLNGHAWTEVYFRGFGWLTVDATPRQSQGNGNGSSSGDDRKNENPPSLPPEQTPTPTPGQKSEDNSSPQPSDTPSPEPTPSDTPSASPPADSPPPGAEDSPPPEAPPKGSDASPRDPGDFFSSPLFWLLLLLLLLLLALAVRIVTTSPAWRARRAASDVIRAGIWAQEIADLLHADHWQRKKGESLLAFTCRIDRSGSFTTALQPVGEFLSLMSYARHVPGETELTLMRDTAVLLKGELPFPARIRYLIRRLFLPLSRRDWTK